MTAAAARSGACVSVTTSVVALIGAICRRVIPRLEDEGVTRLSSWFWDWLRRKTNSAIPKLRGMPPQGHACRLRRSQRPVGYVRSSALVVSVSFSPKIIWSTKSDHYLLRLNARNARGRPTTRRIWRADIIPWSLRTYDVSPDEYLPIGECLVPDTTKHHGGRLRFAEKERLSVDAAGSVLREVGYVPISFPVVRHNQPRIVRTLRRARLRQLADEATGPKGKEFIAQSGFSDIPGNTFSPRQRIAAYADIAEAMAKDVPRWAYSFATILAGVVDLRAMSAWDLRSLMAEAQFTVADSLRTCDARIGYCSGFWELAEHSFPNPYAPIHEFINASSGAPTSRYSKNVMVLHLHLSLLAHTGVDWVHIDQIKTMMESRSTLPHQIQVKNYRRFGATENLRRVAGYAEKPWYLASRKFIVQDALFRHLVPPGDQWPEGWLQLYERNDAIAAHVPQPILPPVLRRNALWRDREIAKFMLFDAAGPFRQDFLWWG